MDGRRGPSTFATGDCRRVEVEPSDRLGESPLLVGLLAIVIVLLVVVAARGVVHEVERLAVEVGREGVMAQFGVDHGGALKAVDDVRELGEQASADGEGFVEASFVGEIDGGVGELSESVVVVEGEHRREGPGHRGDVGSLDGLLLLIGSALLAARAWWAGRQHFLYFLPLWQGQGSFRPIVATNYMMARHRRDVSWHVERRAAGPRILGASDEGRPGARRAGARGGLPRLRGSAGSLRLSAQAAGGAGGGGRWQREAGELLLPARWLPSSGDAAVGPVSWSQGVRGRAGGRGERGGPRGVGAESPSGTAY